MSLTDLIKKNKAEIYTSTGAVLFGYVNYVAAWAEHIQSQFPNTEAYMQSNPPAWHAYLALSTLPAFPIGLALLFGGLLGIRAKAYNEVYEELNESSRLLEQTTENMNSVTRTMQDISSEL